MASIAKIILGSFPHLVLATALLLYVPWTLGIPGDPNADYALGWNIGFYALNVFIAFYAILGVLGVLSQFGWVPIPFRWIRTAQWCSVGAFLAAMAIALFAIFN